MTVFCRCITPILHITYIDSKPPRIMLLMIVWMAGYIYINIDSKYGPKQNYKIQDSDFCLHGVLVWALVFRTNILLPMCFEPIWENKLPIILNQKYLFNTAKSGLHTEIAGKWMYRIKLKKRIFVHRSLSIKEYQKRNVCFTWRPLIRSWKVQISLRYIYQLMSKFCLLIWRLHHLSFDQLHCSQN